MAKAAFCSLHHFAHIFKSTIGYSPYEYLTKYRITRAKSLLKESTASIDEISWDVGFDSTSNFIKTFRGLEGVTPLKYRKLWSEL
jgi:transcriptional regulator GlxA family with amidase domain